MALVKEHIITGGTWGLCMSVSPATTTQIRGIYIYIMLRRVIEYNWIIVLPDHFNAKYWLSTLLARMHVALSDTALVRTHSQPAKKQRNVICMPFP